jgi:DNA-binding IscR family transcriptional regulator
VGTVGYRAGARSQDRDVLRYDRRGRWRVPSIWRRYGLDGLGRGDGSCRGSGLTIRRICNIICYMTFDARLSGALHLLLHMAEFDGPTTSATLAQAMRTNPVVVRRMMSGLRNAGYVRSERGHGGGWEIACDLESTSLLDIYRALGSPTVVAFGSQEPGSSCLVERAVTSALSEARAEAERTLLARLGEITLASLSEEFHRGMTDRTENCLEQARAI